jgi:hypothetical protein
MKFLSTLGIKREKRDRKATSHLYLLTRSSTDPIRFLVCKEQEQQEQQQKQTRRDKKKGSISRNSLGPFQTIWQNLRANLYVVPDIFFDQEGYFGKWKSGDSQESEAWIAGLVDSRGGGGGGVILSVVGAIDKRNRGKIALRSSCLLAMVRRKRRVLSYRLSGETPAGAYKTRLG